MNKYKVEGVSGLISIDDFLSQHKRSKIKIDFKITEKYPLKIYLPQAE